MVLEQGHGKSSVNHNPPLVTFTDSFVNLDRSNLRM
jgi:hypothetical protein